MSRPTAIRLDRIDQRIIACQRCPRLRTYCQKIAREKRAAFRAQRYWGKPVPNFCGRGAPGRRSPRLLIVGLAPAAHGANRTGRMFTGDRSGDFLYEALHAVGLASQPTASAKDDGLELYDTLITAAIHCAPPGNKPSADELDHCSEYLADTYDALVDLKAVVCLGKMGHDAMLRLYKNRGWVRTLSDHPFAHGAVHRFDALAAAPLYDSYHPSQQNTFTGRLTQSMFQRVLRAAKKRLGAGASP